MMNPFDTIIDDIKCSTTSAEDRLSEIKFFNRAQCEAALKVEGLQKTVIAALQRRLRHFADVATTVTLEDRGQDFLEWDIDVTGTVIGCRPYQAGIWCGRRVVNHASLRKGTVLILENMNTLRYPAVEVQRFPIITRKPK